MSEVAQKTLGQLIDELAITNTKIFSLVDIIHDEEDDEKVANAARKAQDLNLFRSQLVAEIDRRLGEKGINIKVRE